LVTDPKAAFSEHTRQYQRVLSCIANNAHVRFATYFPQGAEALINVSPNPLQLTTRAGERLRLHLRFSAQLDQSTRQAHCSRYTVQIHDADGKELAAWHSGHRKPHDTPHVHVTVPGGVLHKKNLPTGFIDLADIVYLLLDQLDAVPQRPDWQNVLRPSEG
jgi:hypothetical protein